MTTDNKLSSILVNLGLNSKEAAIYLALLELGEALPSTISRRTGIKRPTTYVVLESLKEKGVVSHVKKNNNHLFQAVDPRNFFEEHKSKLDLFKENLQVFLNLNKRYGALPQMSVFEGKEGLIQIMEDTLKTNDVLLCWADITLATDSLSEYYPTYIKKKVEKKIWLKGVFCYDQVALKFKKRGSMELREIYVIPKEKFPFKNEINIYDDKVAIISHQDAVGVIIQNQNIADTQRSIFNLGFEYARLLERDLLTKEDKKYLGLI